jgi:hypothetical protein
MYWHEAAIGSAVGNVLSPAADSPRAGAYRGSRQHGSGRLVFTSFKKRRTGGSFPWDLSARRWRIRPRVSDGMELKAQRRLVDPYCVWWSGAIVEQHQALARRPLYVYLYV